MGPQAMGPPSKSNGNPQPEASFCQVSGNQKADNVSKLVDLRQNGGSGHGFLAKSGGRSPQPESFGFLCQQITPVLQQIFGYERLGKSEENHVGFQICKTPGREHSR